MDAFAHHYHRQHSTRCLSVNWADWNFDKNPKPGAAGEENARVDWRMTPGEGIETFRRILFFGKDNQVVVSTVDLQLRIDRWVRLKSLREERPQKNHSPHTDPGPYWKMITSSR